MAITVHPLSTAIEYFLRAAAQPNSAGRGRHSSAEDSDTDQKVGTGEAPAAGRRGGGELQSLLSGAFDPATGLSRSLSQVLGWGDQMNADSSSTKLPMVVYHCGWRVKEEKDALHLSVDMPGLGKEHVHLSVEQNTLLLKGEGDKDSDDEEIRHRRYIRRYHVPMDQYKVDQIRAEMKNGVLKVVLPKVKEEDRKDVFQVAIE